MITAAIAALGPRVSVDVRTTLEALKLNACQVTPPPVGDKAVPDATLENAPLTVPDGEYTSPKDPVIF